MPDTFSRDDENMDLMDNPQIHQRRRRHLSIETNSTSVTSSHGHDIAHLKSPRAQGGFFNQLENPFRKESNHGRHLFAYFGRANSNHRSTARSLSPRRKRTATSTIRNWESYKVYIYAAVGFILLILGLYSTYRAEQPAQGGRPRPMRGHWRSSHYHHADPYLHTGSNTVEHHESIPTMEAVKMTLEWHRRTYDEFLRVSQDRANTRRKQTRPPPLDLNTVATITPSQLSFLSTPSSTLENVKLAKNEMAYPSDLCGDHAKNASRIHPHLFTKHSTLNKNSVILITGIFSPLGYHLAIQLAQQCKVQVLMAVDPMYPTNYLHLLRSQQNIAFFFKRFFPALQQPIPVTFVGLDRRLTLQEMEPRLFLNTTGEVNNLAHAKITHVIHLSSSDPYLYRDFTDDKYKERYEHRHSYVAEDRLLGHLFGFRQSVVSMEQLLMGLSTHVNNPNIQFSFVSTWDPLQVDADPTMAEEHGFFVSAKLMDEFMARAYGKLKQVRSVAVRLPMVYGPAGRQGSLMYELAEKASYYWSDPRYLNHTDAASVQSYLLDMIGYKGLADSDMKDLLFIDDTVDAILASMQFNGGSSSATTLDISSGQSVAVNEIAAFVERQMAVRKVQPASQDTNYTHIPQVNLSNVIQQASNTTNHLIQWSPVTTLETGIRRLLSWHLDKNIPYGSTPDLSDIKSNASLVIGKENGNDYLIREKVKLCAPDDLYCLRDKLIYPCMSECASLKQCKSSPYDDVKSLSWSATEACDTVLYTSFIGKAVDSIDNSAPNQTLVSKQREGVICSLAFLPKESPVLKIAIGNITQDMFKQMNITDRLQSEKDTDRLKRLLNETNGRLTYKGWTLIFLGNASDLPKLDHSSLWLAPLSPKRLFHPSVKYAMYLANITTLTPGLDDVLFLTSQMWRPAQNALKTNQRVGSTKRGNKELLLDPEPERKVGLLLGALRIAPPDDPLSISPYKFNFPWLEARYAMSVERTGQVQKGETLSVQSQREFYERATPYVNNPPYRSGYDPMYNYFPYFWAGTRWMLHDLQSETSRKLRCDWYQEHSLWENEYDQLSFAHVMARREVERKALRHEPDDIARDMVKDDPDLDLFTDKNSWYLIIDPYDHKLSLSSESRTFVEHDVDSRIVEDDKILDTGGEFTNTNEFGDEDGVYVRIMTDLWAQFYRTEWKKSTEALNF